MLKKCVVVGCNSIYSKGCGIHFFLFPKNNPELRIYWIQAINRKNWHLSTSSRVCQYHFEDSDFCNESYIKRKLLKRNAIPTLNLGYSNSPEIPSTKILGETSSTLNVQHVQECNIEQSAITTNTKQKRKMCDCGSDVSVIKMKKLEEENIQLKKLHEVQHQEHVQYINKQKEVFANILKHEKEAIQKKLNESQMKYKLLNRKIKRKDSKIQSLSKLLEVLKSKGLIEKDTADTLQEFAENIQPIIQNEIGNKGKMKQGRRYSDAVKQFAFTLHYHSPRAYEYCRLAWVFTL